MIMKANELMVGDWVRQKESGLLLQVSEIVPPYIRAKGESGQFEESTIEPVSLTDAILTANDFYHDSSIGWLYEDDEYEVIVSLWSNEYRILYRRDVVVNKRSFRDLAVHELQQARRLVGIETEIKMEE